MDVKDMRSGGLKVNLDWLVLKVDIIKYFKAVGQGINNSDKEVS
jgi:hypothetical protein